MSNTITNFSSFDVKIFTSYTTHEFTLINAELCVIDWGDEYIESNISGDSVDVSHLYTEPGTYTIKISNNCTSFKHKNNNNYVSKVNYLADSITSCSHMFDSCYMLNSFSNTFEIPLSVYTCDGMFTNCINITDIPFDLSNNIQNTGYMFYNCKELLTLKSTFNLPESLTFCAGMFIGCVKLQSLPNIFKLRDVVYFNSMFESCEQLCVNINLLLTDEWFNFNSKNVNKMFFNCYKIFGKLNNYQLWNNTDVDWVDTTDCFTNCVALTNYDNIPTTWGGVYSPTSSSSSSSYSSNSSSSINLSSSSSSSNSSSSNAYKPHIKYYNINIKKTKYKSNSININKVQLTDMAQNINYNRYNIYNNFDCIIYDFDLNTNFKDVCILPQLDFVKCFFGCVYDAITNEKIFNAEIQLIKEDVVIYKQNTYDNGCFYFNNVLYGVYHLRCVADDYVDYNSIIIIDDNIKHDICITMLTKNISGVVKDIDNNNLISGCNVTLNLSTIYNSSDGNFIFEKLKSNEQYQLQAYKDNSDYVQIEQSTKIINLLNKDITNVILYLKNVPPRLIGTYFKSYGITSNSNFYQNSGEIPYTYPIDGLTGIGPFSSDVEITAEGILDDVFYVFEGTDPHALPYYSGPGTYENGRIFYTELGASRHGYINQNLGVVPANTIFSIMFVDSVRGQAVWQGTIKITPKQIKNNLSNVDIEISNEDKGFYKFIKIYKASQTDSSSKILINTFNINDEFSVIMDDNCNYYVYVSN